MVGIGRIIALAAVLIAGCSQGHFWVGKWSGELEIAGAHPNPAIDSTLKSVSVEIEENGTFEMVLQGVPYTGVASLSGDSATLSVRQILGRDLDDVGEEMVVRSAHLAKIDKNTARLTLPGDEVEPVELLRNP